MACLVKFRSPSARVFEKYGGLTLLATSGFRDGVRFKKRKDLKLVHKVGRPNGPMVTFTGLYSIMQA